MPIDTEEPAVDPKDEPIEDADPKEDGGRAEEPEDKPDASPDPKDDIQFDVQPPKGLEKESEALKKQYRDAWLKKNSENADRIRALEIDRDRHAQEATRRQSVIDQAAIGKAPPPAPEPIPEFQDMGQLTRYVEDRASEKAQKAADQKINNFVQQKAYEERWVTAWNSVAETDKTAHLFRDLARNELMNPKSPYLSFYTGNNEAEVLQKTINGIRGVYENYTNTVKQQVIADMKRKTTVVTEKPGKSISVSRDPKTQTKADIIAEMNATLGSDS